MAAEWGVAGPFIQEFEAALTKKIDVVKEQSIQETLEEENPEERNRHLKKALETLLQTESGELVRKIIHLDMIQNIHTPKFQAMRYMERLKFFIFVAVMDNYAMELEFIEKNFLFYEYLQYRKNMAVVGKIAEQDPGKTFMLDLLKTLYDEENLEKKLRYPRPNNDPANQGGGSAAQEDAEKAEEKIEIEFPASDPLLKNKELAKWQAANKDIIQITVQGGQREDEIVEADFFDRGLLSVPSQVAWRSQVRYNLDWEDLDEDLPLHFPLFTKVELKDKDDRREQAEYEAHMQQVFSELNIDYRSLYAYKWHLLFELIHAWRFRNDAKKLIGKINPYDAYQILEGYDLTLMSVKDVRKIDENILLEARKKRIPILIKTRGKFIIYGDPKSDGNWQFTNIESREDLGLNLLPFEKGILLRDDPLFNPLLIEALKRGHALHAGLVERTINNPKYQCSPTEKPLMDLVLFAKKEMDQIDYRKVDPVDVNIILEAINRARREMNAFLQMVKDQVGKKDRDALEIAAYVTGGIIISIAVLAVLVITDIVIFTTFAGLAAAAFSMIFCGGLLGYLGKKAKDKIKQCVNPRPENEEEYFLSWDTAQVQRHLLARDSISGISPSATLTPLDQVSVSTEVPSLFEPQASPSARNSLSSFSPPRKIVIDSSPSESPVMTSRSTSRIDRK